MIELLSQMNHWHWLALGLLLLCGELLGAAGYMLWLGISGLLVGILLSFIDISWALQWSAFAVFSLALTWLWWRKQHKQDKLDDTARSLNQKEKQLVGQTARLEQDIEAGKCRIKLGDTTWSAYCNEALPAGTQVKVTDMDGIVLYIEPVHR